MPERYVYGIQVYTNFQMHIHTTVNVDDSMVQSHRLGDCMRSIMVESHLNVRYPNMSTALGKATPTIFADWKLALAI